MVGGSSLFEQIGLAKAEKLKLSNFCMILSIKLSAPRKKKFYLLLMQKRVNLLAFTQKKLFCVSFNEAKRYFNNKNLSIVEKWHF